LAEQFKNDNVFAIQEVPPLTISIILINTPIINTPIIFATKEMVGLKNISTVFYPYSIFVPPILTHCCRFLWA